MSSLLINPHDSLETTVKMKPSLITFQVDSGEGGLTCDQFLPFSNVMSDIHGGWPEIGFLDQLWEALRHGDKLEMLLQNLNLTNKRVKFSQWMHFLYQPFYVNMKNQHFFLLILLLPGSFVQMTFHFLSVRVHAWWMCYDEQSLYLYLEKKKLPKDIKIQAKASSNRIRV